MRVEDYAKYINVLHDLALIEDDLRNAGDDPLALAILFERFGHDV